MEREEGMYVKLSLTHLLCGYFLFANGKLSPWTCNAFDPNPQQCIDGVLKDVSFSSYFIAGSVSSSPMDIIS